LEPSQAFEPKSFLSGLDRFGIRWEVEPAQEAAKRPVRIAVYIGRDRPGLLSEITGAISSRPARFQ